MCECIRIESCAVIVGQRFAEAIDRAERRAQVVGDRVVERFELFVRGFELRRARKHSRLELFIERDDLRFRPPFHADIAEDVDAADRIAAVVDDRCYSVVDRRRTAVATENRQARFVTDDRDDLTDRTSQRGRRGPAGQELRDRVEQRDAIVRIGRDHAVADRAQRRREPPLALAQLGVDLLTIERDLDRTLELGRLERLEEVAERGGVRRTPKRLPVGVRGEKHDGDLELLANRGRRSDPVEPARKADIHEDEVGSELARGANRVLARSDHGDRVVTELDERRCEVARDDSLVFDDQDPRSYVERGRGRADHEPDGSAGNRECRALAQELSVLKLRGSSRYRTARRSRAMRSRSRAPARRAAPRRT